MRREFDDVAIVNAAGVSAGIDMALYLVSRLTNEETARTVQWMIQYDPQPPFGGIDYQHMRLYPRLYRGLSSLMAPFYTGKARRLTRPGEVKQHQCVKERLVTVHK